MAKPSKITRKDAEDYVLKSIMDGEIQQEGKPMTKMLGARCSYPRSRAPPFDEDQSFAKRAVQVYQILLCTWFMHTHGYHQHQTIEYGKIADLMEFNGAGMMGKIVGRILWWCIDRDLPLLNLLAVSKDTGEPSEHWWGGESDDIDMPAALKEIYDFDWFSIDPPTIDEITEGETYPHRNPADITKVFGTERVPKA